MPAIKDGRYVIVGGASLLGSNIAKKLLISVEKARRELGWEPQIDIEQGMRRLVAWLDEDARKRAHIA
jgi:hypothetical protein